MKLPFSSSKCAKCGDLMLFRPDRLPFCSKCEKAMCEDAERKVPKLAGGKKLTLHSEAVQE